MRITRLRAHPLCNPDPGREAIALVVVEIQTDEGLTGLGSVGGFPVGAETIITRQFAPLLEGADPTDIEEHWERLYDSLNRQGQRGTGVMALSGVDLALWDLLGHAERVPVYDLLGGKKKDRVQSYATGDDPEWYRELGFTAHKCPHRWTGNDADYDNAVASSARARELFGPEALLMIDTYMTWDAQATLEMANRLAGFNIHWFEDVLTPDLLEAQAELRPAVKPVLLSGGEHEFTHHGFAEIARAGALDLWQPDITWCGGITAGLRILDIAREAGAAVAPHRGGEVWGLHLIMATEGLDLAERNPGRRGAPRDELWLGEPQPENGYLEPSDAPGFGVTLNEALV